MVLGFNQAHLQLFSTLFAACLALLIIFVRLRAAKKPTSLKKIIIPPFAMSTGFLMFVVPQTHIPLLYAVYAVMVGLIFSYPLIATSKMQIIDGEIYLKRSRAFPIILLSLLILRIFLHNYVERYITLPQTGAAFFILAYGMIVPWRFAM